MQLDLNVSLDPTLGCGQAHRWRKKGSIWEGVIGNNIVTLEQTDDGISFSGCGIDVLKTYFRADDDLEKILSEISSADEHLAHLSSACPGLRILKQDEWECLATYLLATNVNVKRIAKMTESVCDTLGKDLGGRSSFPSPKEILDKKDRICDCRLGFRENRFIKLAEKTEAGEVDIEYMKELEYDGLISTLKQIDGVGPKVADCVALFGFGHMNAFPVDVRISKCLEKIYGITGNYRTLSDFGRARFGKNAGYAQEYLYHSDLISD